MKKIILTIYMFIFSFHSVAFANTEAEANMYSKVLDGTTLIFSGNTIAGKTKYIEALKLFPKKQIYTMILISMELWGHHSSAVKFCETMPFPEAKTEPSVYYWCGRIFLKQGKIATAEKFFNTALNLGGDRPHYLAAEIIVLKKRGKIKRAKTLLKKLILISPWMISEKLYPDGKTGLILTLEDLFSTYKHKGRLYYFLALLMWKSGYPGSAYEYMSKAWKLLPNKSDSHYFLLISLLKSLNKLKESSILLKHALILYPDSILLNMENVKYLENKHNYALAFAKLKKMISYDPSNSRILTELAFTAFKSGDVSTCFKYLQYAKLQNVSNAKYYYTWGLYWQKQNKNIKALQMYNKTISMRPDKLIYVSSLQIILYMLNRRKDSSRILRYYNKLKSFKNKISNIQQKRLNKYFIYKQAIDSTLKTGSFSSTLCTSLLKNDFECKVIQIYSKLQKNQHINLSYLLSKLSVKLISNLNLRLNSVSEILSFDKFKVNISFYLPYVLPIYFK